MVAVQSVVLCAVGFLALGVSARDDRQLAKIPKHSTEAAICKRFESHCEAWVSKYDKSVTKSHIHAYCQPGRLIGGTKQEVAVQCTYTKGKKSTNVTTKVIANADLEKVL